MRSVLARAIFILALNICLADEFPRVFVRREPMTVRSNAEIQGLGQLFNNINGLVIVLGLDGWWEFCYILSAGKILTL